MGMREGDSEYSLDTVDREEACTLDRRDIRTQIEPDGGNIQIWITLECVLQIASPFALGNKQRMI